MKFIDLFAGVGGFRRGMELAGHECIGFCEFDKYATASYTSMHLATDDQLEKLKTMKINERKSEILKEEYRNGEWYKKDIKEVTGENIPRADCWCFGAPCQDFSVAGTRSGLKGDRSSLVREVFRILGEIKEEHRPEWIIYENVKGMLSSHKGFDFLAILLEMDELGYDVEWRIFNSKDYGVPQNRERVYTVGHLRRRGSRKIFSEEGTSGENNILKVDNNASNDMVKIAKYPSGNQKADIFGVDGVSRTLIASDYKQPVSVGVNPEVIGGVGDINFGKQWRQGNRIYNGDKVATALEASPVGNAGGMTNLYSVKLDDKKKGDPSFTLTAQDRHGIAIGYPLGVLRNVRSDFGKQIRKQYESGSVAISRHEFLEKEIRDDNISNTLDTVQKDNWLAIGIDDTYGYDGVRIYDNGYMPTLRSERFGLKVGLGIEGERMNKEDNGKYPGIYVQLSDDCTVYAIWYPKYECYIAIRKLTPKECFRLQGWDDEYFEKAQLVNSDSQLYKQAGNGVTVNVVYEIAKRIPV